MSHSSIHDICALHNPPLRILPNRKVRTALDCGSRRDATGRNLFVRSHKSDRHQRCAISGLPSPCSTFLHGKPSYHLNILRMWPADQSVILGRGVHLYRVRSQVLAERVGRQVRRAVVDNPSVVGGDVHGGDRCQASPHSHFRSLEIGAEVLLTLLSQAQASYWCWDVFSFIPLRNLKYTRMLLPP